MCKNNSRNSSKFKGCNPLQLLCNLTGNRHATGYYSCTCPLGVILKEPNATNTNLKQDLGKKNLMV